MSHRLIPPPAFINIASCQEVYQSHEVRSSTPGYQISCLDGVLEETFETDVRQPLFPSSNRFNILADHALENDYSQAHEPEIGYQAVSQRRRMRNSRGAREGKRRRDARRKKAKHDAQKLDEQLSQQLDVLIQNVVIRNLPLYVHSKPLATPLDRAPQMSQQRRQTGPRLAQLPLAILPESDKSPCPSSCRYFQRSSPAVKLPELEACHRLFSNSLQLRELSVDDIWLTCLSSIGAHSSSLIPKALPSWYSALSVFDHRDLWLGGQPVFHDLSSLPEPGALYHSKLKPQESHLWRPRFEKRQSRFFPARSLSQPRVNLPPLTLQPTCHDSIVKTEIEKCQSLEPKSLNLTGSVERLASNAAAGLQRVEQKQRSAANLWNILKPHDELVTKIDKISCQGEAPSYASCCSANVETFPPRFELEDTEVPYVHSNSLIGIANEIATSPYATEHAVMVDSAIYLPRLDHDVPPMVGMNELLVDHDVDMDYGHPKDDVLPLNPVANAAVLPYEHNVASFTDDTPFIACNERVEYVGMDAAKTIVRDPGVHFRGEGELFALQNSPTTLPEESTVDVATFLKMGHGRDCWCQDCKDIPEVLRFDMSNADDEEWTVCTPRSEHGATIDGVDTTEPSSEPNAGDDRMDDRSSMVNVKSASGKDSDKIREGLEEDWIFDFDM